MYSRNNIFETNDIPIQCFFKEGNVEINQTQEYYNDLQTYCDTYHKIYINDRRSITSKYHLFNDTNIDCCSNKQTHSSIRSSNAET